METRTKSHSLREMHKVVWILVGVFTLIMAAYPTAMWRVSQREKFRGFHLKSLAVEGPLENLLSQSSPSKSN